MTDIRPRPAAALASLLLLACGAAAEGRVVSYAPLTARPATPAVQKRTNRHALLVEQTGAAGPRRAPICLSCVWAAPARLVLHDSASLEEPRDVTPGGADASITPQPRARRRASRRSFSPRSRRERSRTAPSRFLFSSDGGATWSVLPLPASGGVLLLGPWTRAARS